MNVSISELTKSGKKIRDELYAHGQHSWGSLHLRKTFDAWLEDLEQAIQEHPNLKRNRNLRGNVGSLRRGRELGGSYRGYDRAMLDILSDLEQFTEGTLAILKWPIFVGGLGLTSLFLWLHQYCFQWTWLDSHKDKIFLQLDAQLILIFLFLNIPFRRHWWKWLPLIVVIFQEIIRYARPG